MKKFFVYIMILILPYIALAESDCKKITIKAMIDGRSELILEKERAFPSLDIEIRWKHYDFAAPGLHNNHNEPTYINNVLWYPSWPFDGEGYNCSESGCKSSSFRFECDSDFENAKLHKLKGRGSVKIKFKDKFSLVIEIDDNEYPSHDWYEFEIIFEPQECVSEVNGVNGATCYKIGETNSNDSMVQEQMYRETHGGSWVDGVCMSSGTTSNNISHSSSVLRACLPGQPCNLDTSSSSSQNNTSGSSEDFYYTSNMKKGSLYDYFNNRCRVPYDCGYELVFDRATVNEIVRQKIVQKKGSITDYYNHEECLPGEPCNGAEKLFDKTVVQQIVQREISKCRTNPKSCGINAVPIITKKSDPNEILNQIKNKVFSIKGYYIHYGDGIFEWIYIPVSLKSAMKLEKGVKEDYSLIWTRLPKNITIIKEGNLIKIIDHERFPGIQNR
ncbi:hypothetical protein [Nitratiruptor tergarcus]|nr:hypothetical protein [Nitratiruptor tergarcus]